MAGLPPLTLKTTDTWGLLVKQGLIMISAVQTRIYKYAVLALLYLGWCISYIDRAAITFAATHIASEFHLKPSDLGLLLSSFFLGYSLLQLPGGWLADRFGSRPVIVISILMWSLFTGLTGMAWSITSLVVIRFFFGIGEGSFPAASIKGIAEHFDKGERPKMSSVLMSSNYIGSMLAPVIIAPLILHFGWRNVFHYIGIVGIIFAIAYWLCVRPLSERTDGGKRPVNSKTISELMRLPLMWQLVAVWFGLSVVNKGLDSWMPTYLMTVRGLDLKAVGLLLPLPYVMAGISTAIGGWLMMRFFNGRERVMLVVSSALTALFVYFMYVANDVTGVIIFQCLAYFFKSFVLAACFALPTKILDTRLIGSSVGMVNLGGQAAGFISPLVIGILVSAFSNYDYAFAFLISAAIFSVVVSFFIRTEKCQPI